MNRLIALNLLAECSGDDIWSLEHCAKQGIPDYWIEELLDCYESGFQRDSQTIYVRDRVVMQYEGIRDVDLALKLGEYLGVDVNAILERSLTRRHAVMQIQQAVEEG